jgi:hypothetical protein
MRIDFTRYVLIAVLSVGLLSCANGSESERRSPTSDISDEICSLAKFSSIIANSPCRTAYLAVQTTPERARRGCRELVGFASSKVTFQPRWTLEITSPASADSSCILQFPALSDVPTPLWPVIEEVLLLAISTYPQEADEVLHLMISILEQMRAHLAEMTQAQALNGSL